MIDLPFLIDINFKNIDIYQFFIEICLSLKLKTYKRLKNS